MTIAAVQGGTITPSPSPMVAPPSGGGTGSLLVPPGATTGDGMEDAMSMIYACMSKQHAQALKSGTNDVKLHKAMRDDALRQEKDALARQQQSDSDSGKGFFECMGKLIGDVTRDTVTCQWGDALSDAGADLKVANDSPRFWHDLETGAKIVGAVVAIVVSVCVTIVTFGAGAASVVLVAALILSSAGAVESNTHVLEKMGVDPEVAMWTGVGCSIAGAICGGVGSLANTPAELSSVAQAAQGVGTAAEVGSAGASVVAAGAHVKNGYFAADNQDARADQTAAEHRTQQIERTIDMIIEGIKENAKSNERALQTLQGAMATKDQTLLVSAGGRVA